jgi:hypothetical protein
MITGIWGTWSRNTPKKEIPEKRVKHFTDQVVPEEDIFAAPPPTS